MKSLTPYRSLSSWWAGATHRAFGATEDIAVRLALAIVPVRSVIRVVDDHTPPMSVDWADRAISYTDFGNNRIVINPTPFTDGKLNPSDALDIATGFGMHEAAHGKHSRNRYRDLITTDEKGKEIPAFRPVRIAAWLWNLVEDVRIEQRTGKDWPGFAAYFTAVLAWMWNHVESSTGEKDEESKTPALNKQLKTAFYACRFPDRWSERLEPDMEPEVTWWADWQADYLGGRTDTKETIRRGLEHLNLDPETEQEMEGLAEEEREEERRGEELRNQIDRLIREGVKGAITVCVSESGEREVVVLDRETADRVKELVREELVERKVVVTGEGVSNPPLHIRKPTETVSSRRAYVGRPNAESEALRAALVFRASAPEFDVKLLRQGRIDDEEVYRWGMKDYRVFSERIIEAKPDVFMGLLVDMSGSMAGEKLQTAQRLSQLLVWALHDQTGVRTQVWGHTGDGASGPTVEIFRLWEQGDPLSRLGLINTLPHANNYDGHAIAWCVNEMRDAIEAQRVLFVLSDGLPSGQGYGGEKAYRHMRGIVDNARRIYGVEVIQIAIDHDLDLNYQAKMFGSNVVPYKDTASLPKQLTQLMGRFA